MALDERARRALDRSDAMNAAIATPLWQRGPGEPLAEVIEVEFETVQPLPPAPEVFEVGVPDADPIQPPPPDIEAIAAALAEEMDRNAARNAREQADAPQPMPMPAASAEASAPAEALSETSAPAASSVDDILAAATSAVGALEQKDETRLHRAPALDPEIPLKPQAPAQQPASYGARAAAVARQAADIARQRVAPALAKAALWLAHNLQRKEIRRRYGNTLALVHGRLLDRKLEQHFYISTLALERFGPDPEGGILYEGPVPERVFNRVMAQLPSDLREFAFVDFRAGRGRAMLLASRRNFEQIIGYEYDALRHDDLQMNVAQFPRSLMACRNIHLVRGDRSGVSVPETPLVLYFANAWREELMADILTYLRESYRHKPRRMYLILENIDEKVTLARDEIFDRVELPATEKLKLRLLSPMNFQIYRTVA